MEKTFSIALGLLEVLSTMLVMPTSVKKPIPEIVASGIVTGSQYCFPSSPIDPLKGKWSITISNIADQEMPVGARRGDVIFKLDARSSDGGSWPIMGFSGPVVHLKISLKSNMRLNVLIPADCYIEFFYCSIDAQVIQPDGKKVWEHIDRNAEFHCGSENLRFNFGTFWQIYGSTTSWNYNL